MRFALFAFFLFTANLLALDFASIQQEPNLERRSQLAMGSRLGRATM